MPNIIDIIIGTHLALLVASVNSKGETDVKTVAIEANSLNFGSNLRDSFDDLYRRFSVPVKKTALKYRFNEFQADDIVQLVFMTAWQNLENLKNPDAFAGWIMTIARNTCLTEIKKQKKLLSVTAAEQVEDVVISTDHSKEDLNWKYSIELMEEIINELDDCERVQVARLFYLKHLSVKEISKELGLKQNTILSHLRRFRLNIVEPMVALMEEKGIEL